MLRRDDVECLGRDSRNPLQSRAADRDENDTSNRRHRFDAARRRMSFDRHPGTWMRGVEAVEDSHRNAFPECRKNRLVVQDLRAVVRQLRRLAVRDLRQGARLRYFRRIGGHNTVHIRPDPHLVGVERGSDNRCRIVGASASQRGDHAVSGRADESCDDRDLSTGDSRSERRPRFRSRLFDERLGRSELIRRDYQIGCVHRL